MAKRVFGEEQTDYRFQDSIGADDLGPIETAAPGSSAVLASSRDPASDQGPCLYLGPAGQRCYRKAVDGGFCSRHQPGATGTRAIPKPSKKVVAATAGLLGVLWPYIYDFLRELFRLFHPR